MLLTGTPLQNSLEELFALLRFLAPRKFTSATSDALAAEFATLDSEAKCTRLRDMLQPHMLRRLKADVRLSIPEKRELIVRVELCAAQKAMCVVYPLSLSRLPSLALDLARSLARRALNTKRPRNHIRR